MPDRDATGKPHQSEAIVAKHLGKRFGSFSAVDDVSFTVRRGVIFGFLGPNGAGKTTTIRMLLGLIKPTSGSASVLGYDVSREAHKMRHRIGYMSQKFSLYRDLTVEENLEFYARIYKLRGARLNQRKQHALDMSDLRGREGSLTSALAGGWKQRLALGCAILHEPDLIFLDEPTAGVDPISRRTFWDLLYRLAEEGATIFVTTHYMDEAERCQQLAFIMQGRLVAQGSPQEIKRTKMAGRVLEVLCSDARAALAVLQDMEALKDVVLHGARLRAVTSERKEEIAPHIIEQLEATDLNVQSVEEVSPSLEDVFISQVRGYLDDKGELRTAV